MEFQFFRFPENSTSIQSSTENVIRSLQIEENDNVIKIDSLIETFLT